MKNINDELKKVKVLIKQGKYSFAKKICFDILDEYPNDFMTLNALFNVLMIEGNYDQALELSKKLDEEYCFLKIATLYMKLNMGNELYDLYLKYLNKQSSYKNIKSSTLKDYNLVQMWINEKYKNLDSKKIYDEEHAQNSIFANYNSLNVVSSVTFSPEIDIKEIFMKAKEYIKNNRDKAFITSNVIESYIFNLEKCGQTVNGKVLNYLIVRTLINTDCIITMHPTSVNYGKKPIDFEQKEAEVSKKYIKVKSGLERFNQKYSK